MPRESSDTHEKVRARYMIVIGPPCLAPTLAPPSPSILELWRLE